MGQQQEREPISQDEQDRRMRVMASELPLDIDEVAAVLGIGVHRLKMMIRAHREWTALVAQAQAAGQPVPVPTQQQLRNMWPDADRTKTPVPTPGGPRGAKAPRVRRAWGEGNTWRLGIGLGRINAYTWQPEDITGIDGGRPEGSTNAVPTPDQLRRTANRDRAVALYLAARRQCLDQLAARRAALEGFNISVTEAVAAYEEAADAGQVVEAPLQRREISYEYLCSLLQEAARMPEDYPGLHQQDQ